MVMEPKFNGYSDYMNDFSVEDLDDTFQFNSGQYSNGTNGFEFTDPSPDLSFVNMNMNVVVPTSELDPGTFLQPVTVSTDGSSSSLSTGWRSPEGDSLSPSDDIDSTNPILKYISQMLMEENMDVPHMFNNYLALKHTEKSLYEVLVPTSEPQPVLHQNSESPEGYLSCSTNGHLNGMSNGNGNYINHQEVGEVREVANRSGEYYFQPTLQQPSSRFTVNSGNSSGNGMMESSVRELLAKNIFSGKESVLQFQRGFEEASKFLPKSNQLVIEGSRGRKNHVRDFEDLEEERSNKQSATYTDIDTTEESELSDMFDKVLLHPYPDGQHICCDDDGSLQHGETNALQQKLSNGSGVGKTRTKKQGKKETVDLRTLLILCAQAISVCDSRTAGELLKQIKENSSPHGDGTQRLAHYFANALEARLDGSGIAIQNFYASLASKKTTAADMLKSYKDYLIACPFKKLSIFFANRMIFHMTEKASALHIVDFGIMYGYQWPILIQRLAMRADGPPKLRITGIELPQRGFRPAETIEATGRRLANYCKRFNVPFEYKAIAVQNWEKIQIEDIEINSNEVLAVNSLFRFERLLDDESAEVDCPRNAVLNLIRKMNPDIFVHSVINGSYNSPFFVTRFKEALFHHSSIFDMFENTLPGDQPSRLMLEREFYGNEAVNVVACEGPARVQRPEGYKQWQNRTTRAGFKPHPLNQELMKQIGKKLKAWYHKEFVIDQHNHWMLQGWKGRILYASSCWVPA